MRLRNLMKELFSLSLIQRKILFDRESRRARVCMNKNRNIPDLLSGEIDRSICREIRSSGVLLSFYVISVPILTRCVPSSRSTLDLAPYIGLYVLRKQYQSIPIS